MHLRTRRMRQGMLSNISLDEFSLAGHRRIVSPIDVVAIAEQANEILRRD